jgi:hypothetical protein
VDGPQIIFASSKSANLRYLNNLADLQTFRKCGALRISDLQNQSFDVICGLAICGFAICGLKLFCRLKTSASPKIQNFST